MTGGRGRSRPAVTGLLVALLLAGCGAGSAGSGSAAATAQRSGSPASARTPPDTAALPACPALPRVAPRADGLPALVLPCLGAGPPVRLSDLRGTPMVLNVWAAWCQPCAEELPRFAAFHRRAAGKVRFFGVHYKAARDFGLAAARDFGLFYPSVQDAGGGRTVRALRATAPPQTFFVAADGRVAGRHVGVIASEQQLAALVKRYLGVAA
ncbi:MAG: cytochrome c biosis protein CcmG, thiol:disulfide interchange protein DsbE [Actinomycetota bacterium]|nr:cytochrome c biosis protein CcmG, thiol:disulfide interchange protein DsbE [Actinomycetota bacterium]